MFKDTPFEAIAKTLSAPVTSFNPAAMQEALGPVQDNIKAWADLAQNQAQEAQRALAETVESIKGVKGPQEAFEVMKASAEAGMAMFASNLKEATKLSFEQFHTSVDAIEKAYPAPAVFASAGKNMKAAAWTVESTLDSMMKKSAAAVASVAPATKAKKAR